MMTAGNRKQPVMVMVIVGLAVLASLLPMNEAFFIHPSGAAVKARSAAGAHWSQGRARGVTLFAKDTDVSRDPHKEGTSLPPGVGGTMASPEDEKENLVTDTILTKKQKEMYLDEDNWPKSDPPGSKPHTSSEGKQEVMREGEGEHYRCLTCGWIYDKGSHDGKSFSAQPDSFKCPQCGASKEDFEKES